MPASPAGQTIGRVSIRVLPDTSQFRRRAQRDLERIEDQLEVEAEVVPELSKTAARALQAQLAVLTRPRDVSIVPRIKTSALAAVSSALSAMSGARVLGDTIERITDSLSNLDRAVPKISAISTALVGLSGVALSSASNLLALGQSIASIGGLALAIPGTLGGIAIGLGVTVAALKDFNAVLPEVGKNLSALQNSLSANFWAEAEAPIRNMVENLWPAFSAGINETATQLGGFFGGLATALQNSLAPALGGMFDGLSESIAIASGGTEAFASIITQLGAVGASQLPALAGWFVNIAESFDGWLQAQGPEGLTSIIDTATVALQNLGGVVFHVGGILAGLANAATQAGGTSLAMLNQSLAAIHATVDSPGFQEGLVGVFEAAHQAMENISTIAGPNVQNFLVSLAGLLQQLLPQVGEIIGTALSGITEALAQPAVAGGILEMFNGIQAGVEGLLPALNPVGVALGALGTTVGTLAGQLGPVLGVALTSLAGILATLLPAINPIIELLGGALTGVLTAISPLFMQVVQGVLPLIEAFEGALAPIIPILVESISTLVAALQPILAVVISILQAAIVPLIGAIGGIVAGVLPPLTEAIQRVLEAIQPVLDALLAVVNFLMPILVPVIEFVVGILADSLVGAVNGVAQVFEGLVGIVQGAWDIIVGVIQVVWGLIQAIFTGNTDTLKAGWERLWNGIKTFAVGLWDTIVGALTVFLNIGILGTAKKIFSAIVKFFKNIWDDIARVFMNVWNSLRSSWDNFGSTLRSIGSNFMNTVRTVLSNGWNAVKAVFTAAWNAFKSTVTSGVSNVVSTVKTLPSKAKSALSNITSTLVNAGKNLIRGFINGIKNMFGNVQSTLGELTSKLTDWKGPESLDRVLLEDAGRLIIDGFINGLESRYGAVRKSLKELTQDVAKTEFEPINAARFNTGSAIRSAVDASLGTGGTKVLNYYAAPGSSISAEEDLFAAAGRARMVGW